MDGMYTGFAGAKTSGPLEKGATIFCGLRPVLNNLDHSELINIFTKEYLLPLIVQTRQSIHNHDDWQNLLANTGVPKLRSTGMAGS